MRQAHISTARCTSAIGKLGGSSRPWKRSMRRRRDLRRPRRERRSDSTNGIVSHGEQARRGPPFAPALVDACMKKLPPRVEDYPTELVDVVPTVLATVRQQVASEFSGAQCAGCRSTTAARRTSGLLPHRRTALSRLTACSSKAAGSSSEIVTPASEELFDLENDPQERFNLLAVEKKLATQLGQTLTEWRARQLAYYHASRNITGSSTTTAGFPTLTTAKVIPSESHVSKRITSAAIRGIQRTDARLGKTFERNVFKTPASRSAHPAVDDQHPAGRLLRADQQTLRCRRPHPPACSRASAGSRDSVFCSDSR